MENDSRLYAAGEWPPSNSAGPCRTYIRYADGSTRTVAWADYQDADRVVVRPSLWLLTGCPSD